MGFVKIVSDVPQKPKELQIMYVVGDMDGKNLIFELVGPFIYPEWWKAIRDNMDEAFSEKCNPWVSSVSTSGDRKIVIHTSGKPFLLEDVHKRLKDFVEKMLNSEETHKSIATGDVPDLKLYVSIGKLRYVLDSNVFQFKSDKAHKPKPIKKKTTKAKRARKTRPKMEYTKKDIRQLEAHNRKLEREVAKYKKLLDALDKDTDRLKRRIKRAA